MVHHFSYLTLRPYLVLTFFVVSKVHILYFYYDLYITHLLLMFIPCRNRRFGDTTITALLKSVSVSPRVFESISKAVQSHTKERDYFILQRYICRTKQTISHKYPVASCICTLRQKVCSVSFLYHRPLWCSFGHVSPDQCPFYGNHHNKNHATVIYVTVYL